MASGHSHCVTWVIEAKSRNWQSWWCMLDPFHSLDLQKDRNDTPFCSKILIPFSRFSRIGQTDFEDYMARSFFFPSDFQGSSFPKIQSYEMVVVFSYFNFSILVHRKSRILGVGGPWHFHFPLAS